jgi:hypothetical protein
MELEMTDQEVSNLNDVRDSGSFPNLQSVKIEPGPKDSFYTYESDYEPKTFSDGASFEKTDESHLTENLVAISQDLSSAMSLLENHKKELLIRFL